MSKLLFGPIVLQASGKLGGVVFSKNHYGAFLRKKTSPGASTSAASRANRSNCGTSSKRWSAVLSAAQQAGWIQLGSIDPTTDRFGNPQKLSGEAMHNRVNSVLHSCSQPRTNNAPANQTRHDIGGFTPTFTTFPYPQILITPTNPLPPGYALVIAASGPLSPGVNLALGYKVANLVALPPLESGGYDITLAYSNKYYGLPFQKGISFRVWAVNTANGARGPTYKAGIIIPPE